MKKIIMALDGGHFANGAFEFAKFLNDQNPILLNGIFLSAFEYIPMLPVTGTEAIGVVPQWFMPPVDNESVQENIKHLQQACDEQGIQFRIHNDTGSIAISSLVDETRFADLLLVSSRLFYNDIDDDQPNAYLEDILKKSECPVMLIPDNFSMPDNILLTYDGNAASVFAIKQFAYLLPELVNKPATLLSISKTEGELPEGILITELASRHFRELSIKQLVLAHKKDFSSWLKEQNRAFIVMGAFSRNMFSELFHKSFAKDIIRETKMPIFIAHSY